MTVQTQI